MTNLEEYGQLNPDYYCHMSAHAQAAGLLQGPSPPSPLALHLQGLYQGLLPRTQQQQQQGAAAQGPGAVEGGRRRRRMERRTMRSRGLCARGRPSEILFIHRFIYRV